MRPPVLFGCAIAFASLLFSSGPPARAASQTADFAVGPDELVPGMPADRPHSVNVGTNVILSTWHRLLVAANYNYTRSESNTTGAFALPASGDALAQEWGVTTPLHRFSAQFNAQVWRNLGVSLTGRVQSGTPYNITLPTDVNSDGAFNDRPAGVGRNSARTPGQWDLGTRLSYSIGFGKRPQAGGGGGGTQMTVQIGGSGGGMPGGGMSVSGGDNKRYHVELYAAAQNVTNHGNYVGYSGVVGSPVFGRATTVLNPRKLELGARFSF